MPIKIFKKFGWIGLLMGILTAGCAGPLSQFTYQASELSRSEVFSRNDFYSGKTGILTATGVANYRLIIGDSLAKALRELDNGVPIVDPDHAVNLINRAGLAQDYTQMIREYHDSGILEKEMLNRIGQALGVRYLILPTLLEYRRDTSTRISILGVRFVETRSSTLRTLAQIWDAKTGDLVWEGSAEVTLAGEDVREKPIPFEEVALLAWKELVKKLP
jgi:hypothetical protein